MSDRREHWRASDSLLQQNCELDSRLCKCWSTQPRTGWLSLSDRQIAGTVHRRCLFTSLLLSSWLLVLSQFLPAVRAPIKSTSYRAVLTGSRTLALCAEVQFGTVGQVTVRC